MATYLYVGNRPGKLAGTMEDYGIGIYRFNEETAEAEAIETVYPGKGFCAGKAYVDAQRCRLYVTNEVSQMPGVDLGGGCVYAYRIDPETGKLFYLNQQPSFAAKPSYVSGDDEGKFLIVTNHGDKGGVNRTVRDVSGTFHVVSSYDEANVVLYPLEEDGAIGETCDIFVLSGSGPKPFQKGPHAHCVVKAPGKNLYVVCDKGGDMVYTFRIDAEEQKLCLAGAPQHRLPGSAPRYCVFHPRKPFLYVNKEAELRLSAFQYDDEGRLTERQVLDDIVAGKGAQADIAIDPRGQCLYVLVREANVINVYDIDPDDGRLTLKQTKPAAGSPRMCAFSPAGKYFAISYPELGVVELLRVEKDGSLGKAAATLHTPSPATINFFVV